MRLTRLISTCVGNVALIALALLFATPAGLAQESVDLKVNFEKGTQTKVNCDFSHTGSVIVNVDDQDKIQNLPLEVQAKITFVQLINGESQAIRFYERANAKIKLDQGKTAPTLDQSNALVVARIKSGEGELLEVASMTGTLEQDELELIQNPADPLTLPAVFNKSGLKEGDKWSPYDQALAKLLRVHKIKESNVQLMLKKVERGVARVYLMGTLTADVDDVSTQMQVSGIALIHLNSQLITSFKLGIQETREAGQIAPGFEGKTKVDMRITVEKSPQLSRESLARYTTNRKIRQRIKWESKAGHFVVNYEPRWKMIAAEDEAAVLRYIDKNELLAQCNIVQLPSRPVDQPLKLETYKTEVAKIISQDPSAQLVDAKATNTESGNPTLCVVVSGIEEGLPVNWFYYHVTNKDGRQVTFVFTLAESVADRVTHVANRMVGELEFLAAPKQTAATKNSADSASKPADNNTQKR